MYIPCADNIVIATENKNNRIIDMVVMPEEKYSGETIFTAMKIEIATKHVVTDKSAKIMYVCAINIGSITYALDVAKRNIFESEYFVDPAIRLPLLIVIYFFGIFNVNNWPLRYCRL